MREIDLTPYKVKVTEMRTVTRNLDMKGQMDKLLWGFMPWSVPDASEVEIISAKLEQCGDRLEVTDREYDLIMQCYAAVRGPDKQIMPFFRRLIEAKQTSVDPQGGIIG